MVQRVYQRPTAPLSAFLTPEAPWRRARFAALAGYVAALAAFVISDGVPTARVPLAAIIVSGLAISRLGLGWRNLRQVMIDWLPFTAVLLMYDRTRGVADHLGIAVHESDILGAERWLFGGVEPTVWLQHHLYSPTHVYWYDAVCTIVYTSHFLATPVLAAIFWLHDRALWLRHITRVIVLSLGGLLTYILFPEAPPWFAARDRLSVRVERLSPRGWDWFHAGNVNSLLTHAQGAGANPVAAMPSLHTAFATLVAIIIGTRLRSRWRWALALYPAAMAFTLVYTGEHYVLDLVAGVGYAIGTHYAVSWWERRRAATVRSASLDACVSRPGTSIR